MINDVFTTDLSEEVLILVQKTRSELTFKILYSVNDCVHNNKRSIPLQFVHYDACLIRNVALSKKPLTTSV